MFCQSERFDTLAITRTSSKYICCAAAFPRNLRLERLTIARHQEEGFVDSRSLHNENETIPQKPLRKFRVCSLARSNCCINEDPGATDLLMIFTKPYKSIIGANDGNPK